MNNFVIKRDGRKESLSIDKIVKRMSKLCNQFNINIKDIQILDILKEIISKMSNEMKTTDIDTLLSEELFYQSTYNTEYRELAKCVLVSNLHKQTDNDYLNVIIKLYNQGIITKDLYNFVNEYYEVIQNFINYNKDYDFDYIGIKVLEKSYLIRDRDTLDIIERPQHLFMRVALGIHITDVFINKNNLNDIFNKIKDTYLGLANQEFINATPTLFNAGCVNGNYLSCFLLGIEDSIDGIYKCLSDCAKISKNAGGIGVHISNIRGNGSLIKSTNRKVDPLVNMLKVFDATARYVSQGMKRKGSIAIYLEPWCLDIMDFLDLRKNQGKDEQRCRDLFTALMINKTFMDAVENDSDWYLMSEDRYPGLTDSYGEDFDVLYKKYCKIAETSQDTYVKKVRARDIWKKVIESQTETGTPYLCNKDMVNLKSNQKNIGTIKSLNLCVAGDTKILTSNGYFPIKDLVNKDIEVWNGEQFSKTTVVKTGTNQKLLKIEFSNGVELECTEYHKFPIITKINRYKNLTFEYEKIDAQNLKIGDKLIKHDLPCIKEGNIIMKYAYTQGLFAADGTYSYGRNKIKEYNLLDLYHNKKDLLPYVNYIFKYKTNEKYNRIRVRLPDDMEDKFYVPLTENIEQKLLWFAGYCDGDACTTYGGKNIQLSSIEKEFLKNIQLMLQTMGINSKINIMQLEQQRMMPKNDGSGESQLYNCKTSYRLTITTFYINKLINLGFKPKRLILNLNENNVEKNHYISITKITDEDNYEDTYCFNEPIKNMGMFNGVITGNCVEIGQYSDANSVACCNLSSICLPKYVTVDNKFDFELLKKNMFILVENMNKIININKYPIPEAKKNNLEHRPLGIGISGLSDMLIKMKIPFISAESHKLVNEIFETMYYYGLEASNKLVDKFGIYSSFNGSPLSKGKFQFNLWNEYNTSDSYEVYDEKQSKYDWKSLRENIISRGVCNSLLLCAMPTASTANILNVSESFEPHHGMVYSKNLLSGSFIFIQQDLIKDLKELNLFNKNIIEQIISDEGSIQNIKQIPQNIKDIYKSIWDIKMKDYIDLCSSFSRFICQSISMNLYMANPEYQKLTSMLFYAFKKDLKTINYYIRSKSASKPIDITLTTKKKYVCNDEICVSCQ
jgi:ribonucleoside-diphosphate reductase alpha chain